MTKIVKKFLSTILVLSLLAGFSASVASFAAEPTQDQETNSSTQRNIKQITEQTNDISIEMETKKFLEELKLCIATFTFGNN